MNLLTTEEQRLRWDERSQPEEGLYIEDLLTAEEFNNLLHDFKMLQAALAWQPMETIPVFDVTNKKVTKILAHHKKLAELTGNPNHADGVLCGWVYDGFFSTPGPNYALEELDGWMHLPPPQADAVVLHMTATSNSGITIGPGKDFDVVAGEVGC